MTLPSDPKAAEAAGAPVVKDETPVAKANRTLASETPLVVLLIDSEPERARQVELGLRSNAVVKLAPKAGGAELINMIETLQPDVIIIDCESPDRDALEDLRNVARRNPRPIVMFVENDDGETARQAIRAGVSAYIVDGLSSARVQPVIDIAIERFRMVDALHKELAKSREDLAARKIIERAKGILMDKRGMNENAAYEAMRSMAMNQGRPLKEVAESIISVTSLLDG